MSGGHTPRPDPPPGSIDATASVSDFFIAVGGGIALFAIFQLVRAVYYYRAALRNTEQKEFERTINSGDLETIGFYLKHELGGVAAAAYASNERIRSRIDRSLRRIGAMVALPAAPNQTDEVSAEIGAQASEPSPVKDFNAQKMLDEAWQQIKTGKPWNGLFSLRRDIEMRLKPSFSDAQEVLRRRAFKDPIAAREFGRFHRIASRAIHGAPISVEEALQALASARVVYAALEEPSAFASASLEPPSGS